MDNVTVMCEGRGLKRFSVGQSGAEPRWRIGHGPRLTDLPDEMAEWLFDAGSLTKRLRQAGEFRVELLKQQFERPLLCERRALGLDDRAIALVRQVHLYCAGEIKVYARTVMPLSMLHGSSRGLARLGGRPLGEMLFRDKSMRRSPMQIARVDEGDLFYRWGIAGIRGADVEGQIWGRRSVFRLSGQPLLVNEIFLPPLPPSRGFRIKHKV
ncbi:MAG TPA: chorismate lyase [Candidatus Tenderia electrophaga]|uniref:Probable chorismate pyruvate-lyase n=1 Tax=Candidatus Tenderia electrophaga TaxID=1748243 RepID=A0A832J772_9GAMM|nr:chorismate lyase [Candidatus Tenderia electrophaga]